MISKNELKFIRSLKNKKTRSSEKRFLVEGAKNVLELLSSGFRVDRIVGTEDFHATNMTNLKSTPFELISKKELCALSTLKNNESALAVVHQKEYGISDLDLSGITFMMDGVSDPGNLGTIIRTLDWFGFDQIICSEDSVEFYNPKVISATMGSFARMKSLQTDLTGILRSAEATKVGTEMAGKNMANWQPTRPLIVVMGSESHGLRPEIQGLLDYNISIAGKGQAESLNVGVAAGIIAAKIVGSL